MNARVRWGAEALLWSAGAMLSAWAAWKAWTEPLVRPAPEPPPARPRPLSDAERQHLEAVSAEARALVATARARLGRWPTAEELEAEGPHGGPLGTDGVPDNRLVPGVAGVVAACPAEASTAEDVDWAWCEATGEIVARY